MGVLDEILVQGKDSRLYQALVQRAGLTGDVQGGINSGLGDMFNVNGPTLWDASLFHDKDKSVDEILKVFDGEIDRVRQTPVDEATRDRALVKVRSALYDKMEQFGGFGKADLLASFALFDDDPNEINRIEAEFRKVTPQLMQKTAQEYLRPENRTILVVNPKAEDKPAPKAESK
jgi:predicted Zn-dependent peptidase